MQITLSPYVRVSGVHPDLVLVLVISWVVLRGLEEGWVWALVGGVSLDMVSGAPFGVFSLALLISALLASLAHGRLFGSSIILPLTLAFPISLVFNGLALLLLALLGRPVAWNEALSAILVPVALLDTALILVVFPLLYFLNRWLHPQPLSF